MKIITYCIIFNIAAIFPYLTAKPIIQYGVIVRENKTTDLTQKNLFLPGNVIQNKKLPVPKYKKTFQIKSPLKAKKVKYSQRSRNKRKNQTTKKDYYHYDTINQNYIPILKNLGLLFNHILGSDASDIDDSDHRLYKSEKDDSTCECAKTRNADSETANSQKKAVTTAWPFSTNTTTTPTTATTPTYNITDNNISNFRRNKNISLLLSRNTTGFRRNDYRFRQRSSPTYNRSIERHVPWSLGNNERDTRIREVKSYTENYIENTSGNTRNNASSSRSSHELRRSRKRLRNLSRGTTTKKPSLEANKTSGSFKRNVFKHKGKNEFKTAGNKTKNTEVLSKSAAGLRRYKLHEKAKSYETTEGNEEKITEVTFDATSSKRVTDGNCQTATENQEVCTRNEELTTESPAVEHFDNSTNETLSDEQNTTVIQQFNPRNVKYSNEDNKSSEEIIEITFNTTKIRTLPTNQIRNGQIIKDQENQQSYEVTFTASTISTPVEKFVIFYDAKKAKQDFKQARKTKIAELKLPGAQEHKPGEKISCESSAEKSFEITFNTTNIKQMNDQKGQNSKENEENHKINNALTTSMTISTPIEKFVMIYDGYSVARDVNGKNILTEKSITIRD